MTGATHTRIGYAPRPKVDIDCEVAFLSAATAYKEPTSRVERVETHFSWVFLTDKHVFKLKKPLRDGGVDFSTLAARRRNAEQEVKLNRRLARDVYLAVLPLTLDNHRLAIAGRGVVVDWLVHMRRLPAQQMLDSCLARGDWRYAEIHALGSRLAGFFAAAPRARILPRAYIARLRSECRLSRRAFWCTGDRALRCKAETIGRRLEAFIARRARMLSQRVEQGRVVEGHGDLRPEHVCLRPAPLVIDCLEFRADLRWLDPLDELAFLATECERLGAAEIGPILFSRYRRRTGDDGGSRLINFYKAVNALIRARIAILHLQELPVRDAAKWPQRAAQYLLIAHRAVAHLDF